MHACSAFMYLYDIIILKRRNIRTYMYCNFHIICFLLLLKRNNREIKIVQLQTQKASSLYFQI